MKIDAIKPEDIKTTEDVKSFFQSLIVDEQLIFHPDTPFEDYINGETKLPTYSDEAAEHRNNLMDKCFDICGTGDLIYQLAIEVDELVQAMNNRPTDTHLPIYMPEVILRDFEDKSADVEQRYNCHIFDGFAYCQHSSGAHVMQVNFPKMADVTEDQKQRCLSYSSNDNVLTEYDVFMLYGRLVATFQNFNYKG